MTDFELLRDLRTLRRPAEPVRDLWPDIASRIGASAALRPRRALWPEALAAGVVLGLGLLLALPSRLQDGPAAPPVAGGLPWSVREAQSLDAAYAGALREARGVAPAPRGDLARAERELDAAQRALEDALAQQPEAVHLLDLLRRTHEQRLRLAQRQVAMG